MTSIGDIWLKLKTLIQEIPVLLTSIPSEKTILSYCKISIFYIDFHLKNIVDNICYFHEKQL